MNAPTGCLEFKNPAQWRSWLKKHHAAASEAWLVLCKKKYREQGLTLEEALEEALCFGWIDGKLKSLDEQSYCLRFSPRTPASIWSISNIRRVEKLIAEGKMTTAGYEKITRAQDNGEWEAAIRREQVEIIPKDLENVLQTIDGALAAYRSLPDSRKKQHIYWLQSAKREETRRKRIQKIVKAILDQ